MGGRLKISARRDKAQTALGKQFAISGFHDTVLASGAVPIDVFEELFETWIVSRPYREVALPRLAMIGVKA
jgi:uncharacterized protein (DUF885 family)